MRAAVVGLGSMGKRRIRHAMSLMPELQIIGVDSMESRCLEAQESLGIQTQISLDDAIDIGVDCAFVCASPMSHEPIVTKTVSSRIPTFVELNLLPNGYDRFIPIESECKLFLSSTFLYRKDIQYIIQKVGGSKANYVYHSGQYLPDWHPWEDYRDMFLSRAETNGCKEILAIELPWLVEAFGPIKGFECRKASLTALELPYPDSYSILLEHEGGSTGLLAVDVASREASRRFEAFNEQMHVRWEGRPDTLFDYDLQSKEARSVSSYENVDHDERYSPNIIEDAYRDEVAAFLAWVFQNDDSNVRYSYEKDGAILRLIDGIERS